jgi:hypothetical protein
MADEAIGNKESAPPAEWTRYGTALSAAMAEVMADVPEETRPLGIEAAEYWLTIGLIVGIHHRDAAGRLLRLIERDEREVSELAKDAAGFIDEALE